MDCGHCKDCKWWVRQDAPYADTHWGDCRRVNATDARFEAILPKEGIAWEATLLTDETFGCVEFAPRAALAASTNEEQ